MTEADKAPVPAPPATEGVAWFAQAHSRIADMAAGDGAPGSLGSATAPPADEAAILIDLLGGARLEERSRETLVGPEAMAAYAATRGLHAELAFKAPGSLTSADFPVLFLLSEGGARLLKGRKLDAFEALGREGRYHVELDQLTKEGSGSLLLLRAASVAGESQVLPEDDPFETAQRFVREQQRWMLARLMVAAAISNILLLALPIYSGLIFDRVIPHAALDTLWAISLGVMLALGADLALRWVRLKIQDAIGCRVSAAMQAGIIRRLVGSQIVHAPRQMGAMALRLREIEQLAQTVPALMVAVAVDAPFLLVVFFLIWLNGGLAVFAPVLGVLALVAVHHLSQRASHEPQARAARLAQAQTNRVAEMVEGLETLKACRMERRALGHFEANYSEYAYASHVGRFWHGFAGYASAVIGQAMIVLVTIIGVYQVTTGTMSLGALMACTLLVSRIIAPVGQLVSLLHRARQVRETLRALSAAGKEVQEAPGDPTSARALFVRGELRFEGVSFTYPGQSAPQVEGLSFVIHPGEKVAIIGRSGSGKSTILRLLARFYEPVTGAVLIDGMDARQYQPHTLRRAIAFLGQNPGLMDDTVLANLTYGAPGHDPERIEEIASMTGVKDIVARHPAGYGLAVGPRGEALSGGERQAVALARTLLCEGRVVILDEPTAAMDTVIEARLARELKAALADKTVVLATHRAPMLELADRLIWIERGRLVADGPKEEVLRRLKGAA